MSLGTEGFGHQTDFAESCVHKISDFCVEENSSRYAGSPVQSRLNRTMTAHSAIFLLIRACSYASQSCFVFTFFDIGITRFQGMEGDLSSEQQVRVLKFDLRSIGTTS